MVDIQNLNCNARGSTQVSGCGAYDDFKLAIAVMFKVVGDTSTTVCLLVAVALSLFFSFMHSFSDSLLPLADMTTNDLSLARGKAPVRLHFPFEFRLVTGSRGKRGFTK